MKNFMIRLWDDQDKKMLYSSDWGDLPWSVIEKAQQERRLMVCSGIKDSQGNMLFEGDYLTVYNIYKEESYKAQMVFKNAQFMLETAELSNHSRWINYEMSLIGNRFENSGMLQVDN